MLPRPQCTQYPPMVPMSTPLFTVPDTRVAATPNIFSGGTAVPTVPVDPDAPGSGAQATPAPVMDLADFKTKVKNFVDVQSQITAMAADLKKLRQEGRDLHDAICDFMGDNDIEDLHTKNMRLKLKTSNVKLPLKKEQLRERVKEFLGDEEQATDFFVKVYDTRDSVQRKSLRRLKSKVL